MALRRELHRRGYRFRVNFPVPGLRRRTIDVAFTRQKVAVFVDGCFWHACPEHATWPKSNGDWWRQKLAANVARDDETASRLQGEGWRVVRIWEHATAEEALDSVLAVLPPR
jgi:DNA mismatch endonuclease (patch repair protein)